MVCFRSSASVGSLHRLERVSLQAVGQGLPRCPQPAWLAPFSFPRGSLLQGRLGPISASDSRCPLLLHLFCSRHSKFLAFDSTCG